MSEITLVTSSDEHLADLAPGFRKDDYRGAIMGKLEWQGLLARRLGADAFLRGGDFFHVKAANKTTMSTLAMAAELHRRFPCPVYALGGNHDMSNNDPSTVPRQPLGVLLKSGVFRPLRDETFTSGTLSVRVVGVDYTSGLDDDGLREMVKKRPGDGHVVAFVHALAAHAPEERIQSFFGERVFDYRDLVFEGCPDVYVFGHYHKDQGVRDHLGVKFVNLGAVSRGALTFENLDRVPKVSSIRFDSRGVSVEEHAIPCADALAVFDLEKKKSLDQERKSLDDFVSKLRSQRDSASGSGVQARVESLRNSDYPEDLKSLVRETLEAAEHGVLVD